MACLKIIALNLSTMLCLTLSACSQAPATPPPVEVSPTAAAAAVPETPAVKIEAAMDCTGGPGGDYGLVTTFQPGDQVPVVGKDDYGEYWIVIDPDSHQGCWITRQDTTAQGEVDYLPNLVPAPTALAGAPAQPENFRLVETACSDVQNLEQRQKDILITLAWDDLADDEDTYILYRDDRILQLLAPDTTEFRELVRVRAGSFAVVEYGIQAFSKAGGKSDVLELTVRYGCE